MCWLGGAGGGVGTRVECVSGCVRRVCISSAVNARPPACSGPVTATLMYRREIAYTCYALRPRGKMDSWSDMLRLVVKIMGISAGMYASV